MSKLCFKNYDAIGFDVDHTFAKYNIPHLFNVSFMLSKAMFRLHIVSISISGYVSVAVSVWTRITLQRNQKLSALDWPW